MFSHALAILCLPVLIEASETTQVDGNSTVRQPNRYADVNQGTGRDRGPLSGIFTQIEESSR